MVTKVRRGAADMIKRCRRCGKEMNFIKRNANCPSCVSIIEVERENKVLVAEREAWMAKENPRLQLGRMTYEVAERTDQFSRGATFTTTEVKYMLAMETVLPKTILRRGKELFVIKYIGKKLSLIRHEPE